ncbi:hypothetical protein [Streptomyces sp. NEAU-H3]|uniref:hypothetical protein n=1 Tax=Streptomyces sp. NEAU-H3 TaxID=2720636 RepID=UPI00143C67CE|nr:hypothetical protein [Streptomyces sp. NEAU-H3]NJA56685.1 hypothetical protein [Streptomyces sp. NEAU-H3]
MLIEPPEMAARRAALRPWLRANGLDPDLLVEDSVQVVNGAYIRAEVEGGKVMVPLVTPMPLDGLVGR